MSFKNIFILRTKIRIVFKILVVPKPMYFIKINKIAHLNRLLDSFNKWFSPNNKWFIFFRETLSLKNKTIIFFSTPFTQRHNSFISYRETFIPQSKSSNPFNKSLLASTILFPVVNNCLTLRHNSMTPLYFSFCICNSYFFPFNFFLVTFYLLTKKTKNNV